MARPTERLCIPVRVAHMEAGYWLWAELDTGAGGNAYMGFDTLKEIFPDRDLRYPDLPDGLPGDQTLAREDGDIEITGHGTSTKVKSVVLHFKFGKRQPILRIVTTIFRDWSNGGVLVGYPAMKKLGLVLDPLRGGVVAGNGEDLAEATLPSVPAGPLTKAEMEAVIHQSDEAAYDPATDTWTEWRVYFPIDVIGDVEVVTWPVLLDTGATSDGASHISWQLLQECYPRRNLVYDKLPDGLPEIRRPRIPTQQRNPIGGIVTYKRVQIDTKIGDMLELGAEVCVYPPGAHKVDRYVMGLPQMAYYGMRIDLARDKLELVDGSWIPLLAKAGVEPVGPIKRRPKQQEDVDALAKAQNPVVVQQRAPPHVSIELVPSVFRGADREGDFLWMINRPEWQDALFVFNDNEAQFKAFLDGEKRGYMAGGGNAAIRPFTRLERAAGIPTGYAPRAGEGYKSLTLHVKLMIDRAIGVIRKLLASGRYKRVVYSAKDTATGELGSGIFDVGADVKRFIVEQLRNVVAQASGEAAVQSVATQKKKDATSDWPEPPRPPVLPDDIENAARWVPIAAPQAKKKKAAAKKAAAKPKPPPKRRERSPSPPAPTRPPPKARPKKKKAAAKPKPPPKRRARSPPPQPKAQPKKKKAASKPSAAVAAPRKSARLAAKK